MKRLSARITGPRALWILSAIIPSCIEVVNSIVKPLVENRSNKCSSLAKDKSKSSVRGVYEKFSTDGKAAIGRSAAQHGVSATIPYFLKIYPGHPLKESTVRGWNNHYNHEL